MPSVPDLSIRECRAGELDRVRQVHEAAFAPPRRSIAFSTASIRKAGWVRECAWSHWLTAKSWPACNTGSTRGTFICSDWRSSPSTSGGGSAAHWSSTSPSWHRPGSSDAGARHDRRNGKRGDLRAVGVCRSPPRAGHRLRERALSHAGIGHHGAERRRRGVKTGFSALWKRSLGGVML